MKNRMMTAAVALMAGILVDAGSNAARADDAKPGPIQSLPWLHEGLRLTYRVRIATIRGAKFRLVQDPKGWLYGAGAQWSPVERQTDAAAIMLERVDITRIDGDTLVACSSTLGEDLQNPDLPAAMGDRPVGKSLPTGKMRPPSFWVEPDMLASYVNTPAQGVKASRGPYAVGNDKCDAVFIEERGDRSFDSYVYDANSGRMLSLAHRDISSPPAVIVAGDNPSGDAHVKLVDFVAMRDVSIPWATEAAPGWTANIKTMHLKMGQTAIVFGRPGSPMFYPQDLSFTKRGSGWLEGVMIFRGTPAPFAQDWGTAGFFGLWSGPAALAKLQPGQILDQDPIAKSATTVSAVDDSTVTITEGNDGFRFSCVYLKSTGALIKSSLFNLSRAMESTIEVTGAE